MHTHKQYKKKFRIFVASLLLICCIPAKADISASKAKFDVALVADYAQSKDGIEIDSKTFTFKTGSLGVRTAYRTDNLGHFFATAGLGYAPSETATFAGASVSGPLHVQSYSLAFIYPYLFPQRNFFFDHHNRTRDVIFNRLVITFEHSEYTINSTNLTAHQ